MYHKRSLTDVLARREPIHQNFPKSRKVSVRRGKGFKAIFQYGQTIKVFDLSRLSDLCARPCEGECAQGVKLVAKIDGQETVLMTVANQSIADEACARIHQALVPSWRKWGRRFALTGLGAFGLTVFMSFAPASKPVVAGVDGNSGAAVASAAGIQGMPGFSPQRHSQIRDGQFTPDLSGVEIPVAPALNCPEPTAN